jgi:hypothetical protein
MKNIKFSAKIAAALLALGIVSQASADPVVYLTGSTAFRSTIYSVLANNSGTNAGGVFDAGTVTGYTWGTSASGASYMVFHGNISGAGTYIDCAWSGSEAGIASACDTNLDNVDRNGDPIALAGSPETWVNATNSTVMGLLTSPIGNSDSTATPTSLLEASSHGSDLAQADTSQAVSWTPFVAGTSTDLKDYAPGGEGVVTFCISRNNQTGNSGSGIPTGASNEWAHCSNITLPQLNTLFSAGVVQASFISGNTNDSDFTVYLVGRNLGSGTRMNMLTDSTYGGQRGVSQYSIGYGIEETPHVDSLILTNEGNGGYESGGDVAKALGILGSCQQADPFNGGVGWFAIGYMGPSDALNTGNFGGEPTNCWMTVDGVPSNDGTIENGQWWFWGHEHLLGKYGISGIQNTVGNLLLQGTEITLKSLGVNPAANDPAIPLSRMNVVKDGDAGFPHP